MQYTKVLIRWVLCKGDNGIKIGKKSSSKRSRIMSLEIFSAALNNTVKNENSITENGAVGHKSSGTALVNFFFKASSYRNRDENEIESDFAKAYDEDQLFALKTLFFVGDIRGGLGERRLFKTCFNWLCQHHVEDAKRLVSLIPEYSRWDVLVELLSNISVSNVAFGIVKEQLDCDLVSASKGESISLLAKWLPSINTSSEKTVALARRLCKQLHVSERTYRKKLSALRKHLEVVERKMTANEWDEINYNAVPSKANLLYRKAFLKHDGDRRQQYLAALENREDGVKINSGASFPYEIVREYTNRELSEDATLEEMWKALPDYVKGHGADTICIVNGSGSMGLQASGNVTCHDVARSLAIYFSEKMAGAFNNKFITFSKNPKLVDLSKKDSLLAKIEECKRHAEYENTDIEKAFDLILKTAVNNHVSQEDMPKNILILSDMEFDDCVESTHIDARRRLTGFYGHGRGEYLSGMKTLFDQIGEKYSGHGYKLPRLVFWNINSRTDTIPVKENECGVALVSGFSPTIASMVFSGKTTPYDTVIEKLNSSRYDAVENALKA